ncbi:sal-like protein 3b [Plectropomus leopardus]|uniref:sal-like protein 3b n=1 Tax=Plectropomus leopardus TaxID=160734 RepID=UPI001C4C4C58|nr:sal-like protein 3b [Plectropomus leopardus]
MSRRKQAKPQHLRSEEEATRSGLLCATGIVEGMQRVETNGSSEETHICDKCCAEFFTWTELSEHQKVCTEDPLVLIVKDSEGMPLPEESPVGPSPVPSVASSDSSAAESPDAGFELNDNDSLDNLEENMEHEEVMELEHRPQDTLTSSPQPPHSAESTSPQMPAAGSYGVPSTNVTLEILHSTRVAVAQFSQGISSSSAGGKGASAAIPVILEHLLALQQQQVHQLQLIEQICSQVAIMNRQPTQTALNPASRPLSLAPNPFPSHGIIPPPIMPLSGTMPSTINGQAAVSLSSVLEKSKSLPSKTVCGQSTFSDVTCTSASSENSTPSLSSSTLLPPYTGSHTSSISCTQTLSSSSPLPLAQSSLLSSSSSLPFLPQSPPSSVIFPNPLASIAATANALDPLAALMKHRKGKLPNVPLFETKPSPEEPFFKHKCRFCAKVFGSDSALQIHLRSHTGERPFKCNICGNRFSTKGNLKVHFQRHKEKYPHVQMNPYPVPEYLDNVPTSSGIPYGMSIPPEKPVSSWLDSKPVVATLPATLGLPLSSAITSIGGSNDPVSVTASVKSPFQPAPGECVSLSPSHRSSEAHFSPVSESPQSNLETEASDILKTEGVHLPPNCTLRLRANTVTEATTTPSVVTPPEPVTSPASNSPPLSFNSDETKFPTFPDSMQTSETSKLQQLVENIDKKITDPNQCVLCHRVLSCQSALKMHYRIHTGERPFKCKVCGRAFTTKGNLKTHIGVHRENPPVQVQHSCPICQKKFTNAVVLQQHIRMHMVGQIPDSTLVDGLQEVDGDASFNDRNFDSLSSNDNDLIDDISMEDDNEEEEEEEEVENMEEAVNPKVFISECNSPPKSSIVSSIAALENQMRMIDSTVSLNSFSIKSLTNGFNDSSQLNVKCSLSEKRVENCSLNSPNVSESSGSPRVSVSPVQSNSEGMTIKSPAARPESQESLAASVKREQSESPTSASAAAAAQDLRGIQASKLCVKEETPYSMSFQLTRERAAGQSIPSLITSTSSGPIKTEVNGHSQPNNPSEGQHPPFSVHISPAYASVGSPGMTSLLGPAPPRRAPKQHNCNVCGKNFSSASALQIHERTHTGEKPFVCSICGRAFTTKGNLKVHMGTHMWNNAPARRGRRLSVENPMALLGGEAAKFGEMFQKDLAARAMNVDPGFWNRYATAIANSLATKNNEISVIQNRGISQLHPLTAGMDRVSTAGSPITSLTKAGMDLGNNRHFSMLIDDSKEIGIN